MTIKKEVLKYVAGVLAAVLLLWWVFRDVDAHTLWLQIRQASPVGILIAASLNVGHNFFRVWRWRALLHPIRPAVPFRPMFAAVILGYATSWVVPGRLGELVRPLLLSSREEVPLGPCVGSVVADRMLDMATVVALFTLGAWVTPLEGKAAEYASLIRSTAVLMVLAVAAVATVMLVASARSPALERLVEQRGRLVSWIGRALLSLSQGVRSLRSPRLLLVIVTHSLLAWLTITASTWVGVRAVGAEISFGAMLVVLPMLVLGVAVPTPGGAGSYHGAMKIGLMLFGVSELTALSAGLVMHVLVTVPLIALGAVLLWTEKISWKRLVGTARELRNIGSRTDVPVAGRAMESLS